LISVIPVNETLIKLLKVYLGEEAPGILHKFDKRIAMRPEVDDFDEYLRQQYREGDIEYWLNTYEDMVRQWPKDPIMHFNVAAVCTVWSEELENEYFHPEPGHNIPFGEWQHINDKSYRELSSLRHRATYCLREIIEMTPGLPADIAAGLVLKISSLRC
jgi:hypothetical protein